MTDKALVTSIQKFSVHDGPGIRTIVFFAGCPLRCKWCQNPEALPFSPTLMFDAEKCEQCQACLGSCPNGAISADASGRPIIDRERCNCCGSCGSRCWYGARRISAKPYSTSELSEEILRDRAFYMRSGGGVTLSGGEPLARPEFCASLLSGLSDIHTAIETSGYAGWDAFSQVMDHTDLFLYDIKLAGEKEHIKWTGVSNRPILDNLSRLAASGADIILRVPLIPGVNDTDEEFSRIIDIALDTPGVEEIHLLPFHKIGASKYAQLGMEYEMLLWDTGANADSCIRAAASAGFRVSLGGTGFLK